MFNACGQPEDAKEIALRAWDHENSLILGRFTTAQSGCFLVQFNLIWIGSDVPKELGDHEQLSVLIAM